MNRLRATRTVQASHPEHRHVDVRAIPAIEQCAFRFEEEEGMVEEISIRRPRLTQDVEELMDEHPRMLTEIRGVMADVLCYSEGQEPENPQLRRRLITVLDQLRDHERKENHLIQPG